VAFEKIGINLTALRDIKPLNISVSSDYLQDAPKIANEVTGGFLGLTVSVVMFIFLFWYLSDITEYGNFRYTKLRATGIASCIVSILGIVALSVGFFTELYHIVIFMVITIIVLLWVYKEEN